MSHYYVSTTRLGQEKLLILLRLSFLFYLLRGMSESLRIRFSSYRWFTVSIWRT